MTLKRKLTAERIRKLSEDDRKWRLRRETDNFMVWWAVQFDRDNKTPMEMALRAWLARFR